MGRPEISVVIPTRDRWSYLSSALSSAFGQEGVDAEVVVVDDGSTDETPARLSGIQHTGLRVVRLEGSGGVSRARNAGIRAARCEWIAFLDDDDLWAPSKLRLQLDRVSTPEIGLVCCGSAVIDERGALLRLDSPPSTNALRRAILEFNVVPGGGSGTIVRRAALDAVGGFDEQLSILADWDLWIRLAQDYAAATCPEPLVAYRDHGANMSLTQERRWDGELRYLEEKHGDLARALGLQFGGAGTARCRYLAHVYRRTGRRLDAARMFAELALRRRSFEDAARAIAVLGGESVMRVGARLRKPGPPEVPEWLAAIDASLGAEAPRAVRDPAATGDIESDAR